MNGTETAEVTWSRQVLTTDALVRSRTRVDPPPCTRYQCPHLAQCTNQKVACQAFVYYVETGKVAPPKTFFIDGKPLMKNGHYALHQEITPTAENYSAVFSRSR